MDNPAIVKDGRLNKLTGPSGGGGRRGSGDARVVSDYRFKKRCPCPSLLAFCTSVTKRASRIVIVEE